ncbi:MAG: hypothetical protein IIC89_05220 [Chloroflexi bacterium]|nr:hypothetical protein [Chloroflexota bacterium]
MAKAEDLAGGRLTAQPLGPSAVASVSGSKGFAGNGGARTAAPRAGRTGRIASVFKPARGCAATSPATNPDRHDNFWPILSAFFRAIRSGYSVRSGEIPRQNTYFF